MKCIRQHANDGRGPAIQRESSSCEIRPPDMVGPEALADHDRQLGRRQVGIGEQSTHDRTHAQSVEIVARDAKRPDLRDAALVTEAQRASAFSDDGVEGSDVLRDLDVIAPRHVTIRGAFEGHPSE